MVGKFYERKAMTDYEKLASLCEEKMASRGFESETYKDRLKEELAEVKKQDDAGYFLKLLQHNIKAPRNEHNSLIPYLLEICDGFDMVKGAKYSDAEFP
jgi:hypothetical protein